MGKSQYARRIDNTNAKGQRKEQTSRLAKLAKLISSSPSTITLWLLHRGDASHNNNTHAMSGALPLPDAKTNTSQYVCCPVYFHGANCKDRKCKRRHDDVTTLHEVVGDDGNAQLIAPAETRACRIDECLRLDTPAAKVSFGKSLLQPTFSSTVLFMAEASHLAYTNAVGFVTSTPPSPPSDTPVGPEVPPPTADEPHTTHFPFLLLPESLLASIFTAYLPPSSIGKLLLTCKSLSHSLLSPPVLSLLNRHNNWPPGLTVFKHNTRILRNFTSLFPRLGELLPFQASSSSSSSLLLLHTPPHCPPTLLTATRTPPTLLVTTPTAAEPLPIIRQSKSTTLHGFAASDNNVYAVSSRRRVNGITLTVLPMSEVLVGEGYSGASSELSITSLVPQPPLYFDGLDMTSDRFVGWLLPEDGSGNGNLIRWHAGYLLVGVVGVWLVFDCDDQVWVRRATKGVLCFAEVGAQLKYKTFLGLGDVGMYGPPDSACTLLFQLVGDFDGDDDGEHARQSIDEALDNFRGKHQGYVETPLRLEITSKETRCEGRVLNFQGGLPEIAAHPSSDEEQPTGAICLCACTTRAGSYAIYERELAPDGTSPLVSFEYTLLAASSPIGAFTTAIRLPNVAVSLEGVATADGRLVCGRPFADVEMRERSKSEDRKGKKEKKKKVQRARNKQDGFAKGREFSMGR